MVEKNVYEQEVEEVFKNASKGNYDLANRELAELCEKGNTHAKVILMMKDYFAGRKGFEEIRPELVKLVDADCEFAKKVIYVYDEMSAGRKVSLNDIELPVIGEKNILNHMRGDAKDIISCASPMPTYLFMEIPLTQEQTDLAGIFYLECLIGYGEIDEAHKLCRQLAEDGNMIARGYELIMDYFEVNTYEAYMTPENCVKNLRYPDNWKANCDKVYKGGYKYFDLIYEASKCKTWENFDVVAPNHSNIGDCARVALRLILTGEAYGRSVNAIKFFKAESFPHKMISEENLSKERRDNLNNFF